jgi:hypothetical protein
MRIERESVRVGGILDAIKGTILEKSESINGQEAIISNAQRQIKMAKTEIDRLRREETDEISELLEDRVVMVSGRIVREEYADWSDYRPDPAFKNTYGSIRDERRRVSGVWGQYTDDWGVTHYGPCVELEELNSDFNGRGRRDIALVSQLSSLEVVKDKKPRKIRHIGKAALR